MTIVWDISVIWSAFRTTRRRNMHSSPKLFTIMLNIEVPIWRMLYLLWNCKCMYKWTCWQSKHIISNQKLSEKCILDSSYSVPRIFNKLKLTLYSTWTVLKLNESLNVLLKLAWLHDANDELYEIQLWIECLLHFACRALFTWNAELMPNVESIPNQSSIRFQFS